MVFPPNIRAVVFVTAVFLLGVSTFTAADAISNRRAWDNLDARAKSFYALGMLEGFLVIGPFDTDHFNSDLYKCIADLALGMEDFAKVIDQQYSIAPGNWERPPTEMLFSGVREICLTQVNKSRIDRGQQPQERIADLERPSKLHAGRADIRHKSVSMSRREPRSSTIARQVIPRAGARFKASATFLPLLSGIQM